MAPDRRLIFVRDGAQWELDRKRVVEQLARYGFEMGDRMCVSVALDEVLVFALNHITHNNGESAAMVAYSISTEAFHVRIRLVSGTATTAQRFVAGGGKQDRWLLASACMSGVRLEHEGTEIEMWKDNITKTDQRAGAATTRVTRPRRILIAEEDGEVLGRLEEAMRDAGYRVVTCANGWDLVYHLGYYLAPEEYRKEEFDVIVADVHLPGANGLDVLRGLRWQGIPPVVLMVGSNKARVENRVTRYAPAAVLDRSVEADEFLRVISGILSTKA